MRTQKVFDDDLEIEAMLLSQSKINKAVLYKLRNQENTYVHVVEGDQKHKYMMYSDKLPLYNMRMRYWAWIM